MFDRESWIVVVYVLGVSTVYSDGIISCNNLTNPLTSPTKQAVSKALKTRNQKIPGRLKEPNQTYRYYNAKD